MVKPKQLNASRERANNGQVQTYCHTCGRWISNSGYAAHIKAHVNKSQWLDIEKAHGRGVS